MMEVLGKLFELVVDKVPNIIAQTLFSIALFAFRPYRTVVLLVRFARQNKVPTPLFPVAAFVFFMIAVGFAHPFFDANTLNPGAMTKTFSNLSNTEEHKTDVVFVSLFALGVTSLIGFGQLCVEAVRRGRYPQLFRDLHYVAMALNLPWFVAIYLLSVLAAALLAANLVGDLLWYHPNGFVFFLFALIPHSAALMLVFALQMDRRWYRSRPDLRWARRVGPAYVSAAVIMILTPAYLNFLASALYADALSINMTYKIDCFEEKGALYAAVTVENQTASTKFLNRFDVVEGSTKMTVSQPALFEGLKEDVVLRPKEIRRFRLKVSAKDATSEFSDKFTPAVCDIAVGFPDKAYNKVLSNPEVQILH